MYIYIYIYMIMIMMINGRQLHEPEAAEARAGRAGPEGVQEDVERDLLL